MPTPVDVVLALHDALARAGVEHAFGGAIAYGFAAEPRGTVDVDLNLFLAEPIPDTVFQALAAAGCDVDPEESQRRARERGDFRGRCLGYRVDFFVSFHPFHESVRARVMRASLQGSPISVLSAEDLTVFKILFDRSKDWADIEAMIRALGSRFDRAYVRRWLDELLAEGDPRKARFEALHSARPETG